MPGADSSAQQPAIGRSRGEDRSEPFQGLFGVSVARVELEDAVEIVARRATAAKLIIKVGTVAVGHHRFRVELDRLGIVGEPKDRQTFSSP
jgi:hypothetical protein